MPQVFYDGLFPWQTPQTGAVISGFSDQTLSVAHLVSHRQLNGAVIHAGLLSQALHKRGHRTLLVHRPGADFVDHPLFDNSARIESDFNWRRRSSLASLTKELRTHGTAIMHSHAGDAHIAGALIRLLKGPALVQTVHMRIPHWHWWLADRVFCPTKGAKRFMRRIGVPAGRLAHIRNFLSDESQTASVSGTALRHELGIPLSAFVVLCAGSLEQRKAQGDLVQAACQVAAQGIDIHLLLAGRPNDAYGRAGFAAWPRALPGRIHALGQRPDIDRLLASADLFALPSLREEAPLAILEAMRAGLPVVSTCISGIPELVENGITGTLLKPRQIDRLAATLAAYASDDECRQNHGAAGQARFIALFSQTNAKNELLDGYHRALTARGKPPCRKAASHLADDATVTL